MESVLEICLGIMLIAATIGVCIAMYQMLNHKR